MILVLVMSRGTPERCGDMYGCISPVADMYGMTLDDAGPPVYAEPAVCKAAQCAQASVFMLDVIPLAGSAFP